MKRLGNILFVWAVLCIPSLLGLRGCGTAPLLEHSYYFDPPIAQIHAAYHSGDAVIVDYSVIGSTEGGYSIPPGRYWARAPYNQAGREWYEQYDIHREPLPPDAVAGWASVPMIDMRQRVPLAEDGHYHYDEVAKSFRAIPDDQLPVLTYLFGPSSTSSVPVVDESFFSILYLEPRTGKRMSLKLPRSRYIPIRNRIRMVCLWPFSVLLDWVCLPVYILAPRIDG